jgi:hypothetical protein
MRRVISGLLAVATACLLAGPALAARPVEESGSTPIEHRVRLDRTLFDQVGPHVDVQALCGDAGASQVIEKRSASDAIVGVLSVGFYTPAHARVICNVPRGNR